MTETLVIDIAKHGTKFCVFVAKQVIDYYKSNGSTVYLCFLDLCALISSIAGSGAYHVLK